MTYTVKITIEHFGTKNIVKEFGKTAEQAEAMRLSYRAGLAMGDTMNFTMKTER